MNEELPQIEKGVPIPAPKGYANGLKGLVATMEPGDSFVDHAARIQTIRNYAKAAGFKIIYRKIDKDKARFWRDPSATK